MLYLIALLSAVLGQEEIPTQFPTITDAPKSQCIIDLGENGPFALDCLQAAFLDAGCSVRGDSYPTETRIEEGADKEWYNSHTWQEVLDKYDEVKGNDDTACNGADSNVPSTVPTASPSTRKPTPKPTPPPTSLTPAPTFADDHSFTEIYTNDGSVGDADAVKEALEEACQNAGFARQYDMTQYIIKLTMGDFVDYYTIAPAQTETGFPTSICDLLADPSMDGSQWADTEYGPFITVDLEDNDAKMYDGRVYPVWYDRANDGNGGYGAVDEDDFTAAAGRAFSVSISSMRSFSMCTERVAPQTETTGDSEPFTSPYCTRAGSDGQDYSSDAQACAGDSTALHYALANRMYATCDSMCVYSPDYADDKDNAEFWYWKSGSNCWKTRAEYADNEFKECDTEHGSFQYADDYAHVEKEMAVLCSERCDYVNGWVYTAGSCYRLATPNEYDESSGDKNVLKARSFCDDLVSGATLASIADKNEENEATELCATILFGICYLGNDDSKVGEADGKWLDGTEINYANWNGGFEGATMDEGDYLVLKEDGSWSYDDGDNNYAGLCETPAQKDMDQSNEQNARDCVVNNQDDDITQSPELDISESGFTDSDNPDQLHLVVNVPQQFYNVKVTFDDSTNDEGEYHWQYNNPAWERITDATSCDEDNVYEGTISWAAFNLGGAGGVKRLSTWTDENGTVQDTSDEENDDGSNTKYIFGSVMRIQATQPIRTGVDSGIESPTNVLRTADFERVVDIRVPFILQFQKTVTVTTEVDIVSTKFNYKTVAAIIQSIQYETQYFTPPYAKVKLQIRTKSQYPYLFNKDTDTIELTPRDAQGNNNTNINMSIEWLADDTNCTFTNPDHMREGDVCTQEWMLYLTPNDNVCYATGEYTIIYKAGCFYGKDVCYLPFDKDGAEIDTVSFTFKLQTSKFCPRVADEVDLSGTLTVTGRKSFKPSEHSVEDDTEGSMYFQGEKIYLFATTSSEKATITSTNVVMVQIRQNLEQLVQTGYNRVPYDADSEDLTVWTPDTDGRVADGTVTINDGTDSTDVTLMVDNEVFGSGTDFTDYEFSETEAGFMITLHARAFPVNVDSFGSKTIVATLEVEYEALGVRRRRLLGVDVNDLNTKTDFQLSSFRAKSLPKTLSNSASMKLHMTLQSTITRDSVKGFIEGFNSAIVTALNNDPTSSRVVYPEQVWVDAVYADGTRIWSKPLSSRIGNRRLQTSGNQRLAVDFSFANVKYTNAMTLPDMIEKFHSQLKQPASELMHQNIFFGSVVHSLEKIETSEYVPESQENDPRETRDSRLASGAAVFAPVFLFSLFAAMW